jgi:hypothetical protein
VIAADEIHGVAVGISVAKRDRDTIASADAAKTRWTRRVRWTPAAPPINARPVAALLVERAGNARRTAKLAAAILAIGIAALRIVVARRVIAATRDAMSFITISATTFITNRARVCLWYAVGAP